MPLPSNAQELVAQLRQVIWMMRRGQREAALATAVLGLVAAGTYLLTGPNLGLVPAGVSNYVATGCYGLAAVLLVLVVYRLWRQAVPPPLPPPEQQPSAIKGPMAFGPEDGLLFQRLGRGRELAQLLGLTLNDQIPLVVVMGESGVGKTSLLRAGLPYLLNSQHVQSIYWEAVPTQSPERLLHAIQEQWQSNPVPQGWDEVLRVSGQGMPCRVIVLDQFEQLHPDEKAHQPIFDLLRRVATTQMPPYHTTWIVAFRREYNPNWSDFELTLPNFHAPMLSIRLFGEEPAKEVLATLAEAAHLTLDQALVTDLVKAAARDGRVAAVDLGIGLLVLSELAMQKGTSHLSLNDYRFAGGSVGLLTGYLSDRLDRFHEAEREAVLKALLALTDRDTQQRLAEGRSVDELAQEVPWPPFRLQACLDYLAAPHVRLLEKPSVSPGNLPWYRLPHERLIPSLHQLTGVILAAVEQTRVTFDAAFRAWQNNGQHRRYLLDRRRLRQIKKHLTQILSGDPSEAKASFLQSQQKITRRRLAGIILGALVVGMIMTGWWVDTQRRHQNYLSAWVLPSDLYTYQRQLKVLHITGPVSHLRWLNAELTTLAISRSALQDLTMLPPTLTELYIWSDTGLTSLASLEKLPRLTTLQLTSIGEQLTSLSGLEKLSQLTTLQLSGTRLTSLAGLEKLSQLTTLQLSGTGITSLAGLEKLPQLTTLQLSGTGITSLAGLEKLSQLTTLDLRRTGITSIQMLSSFQSLQTLYLTKTIHSLDGLPVSVNHLVLE
jgi:hypothetical protein